MYVRGDAETPWRKVSMVVQDLPRQPEMRKGLLKAIHRANGQWGVLNMAAGGALTSFFVRVRHSPKERRLQKKEMPNCSKSRENPRLIILHIFVDYSTSN